MAINMTIIAFIRSAKRRLRCLTGEDILLRPEAEVATEYHGTDYGGWAIVRDSLCQESVIYSFGIGEDASFDLSVAEKYGCQIHGFDPTPRSLAWVASQLDEPKFHMHPWALGDTDGSLRLFLPWNRNHISASISASALTSGECFNAECHRLATVMKQLDHQHVDVLKMDIEGSEYRVIDEMCSSGSILQIDQLLVEFHHWMPNFPVRLTKLAVGKLHQAGFCILWVSPRGHEVLFRRQPASADQSNSWTRPQDRV
jgi:FkbM family methyltransferase